MRVLKLCLILLTFVSLGAQASSKTIMVHGDSLSAGYGIELSDGWVALLQVKVDQKFPGKFKVVNTSVSGETTTGGKARLPALLEHHRPSIVLLELGGNDGLQGHPIPLMRKNLAAMLDAIEQADATALLIGIQIPPNYGSRYTNQFSQSFHQIADDKQVALVPFLLEGVATHSELMQRDGIHPTKDAQAKILDNVWPHLLPLLNDAN
ncbi:MAG: arylesterase [Cellvibrio sp.]